MTDTTYLLHGIENGGIANPDIDDIDSRDWWDACARHEFTMQQCTDCGAHRYPPKPLCHVCQSLDFAWQPIDGIGRIYSYTTIIHPVHPSLADRVPYTAIIVELPQAGGERIIGNLLESDSEDVAIGDDVELVWEDISEDISLPQWRRICST